MEEIGIWNYRPSHRAPAHPSKYANHEASWYQLEHAPGVLYLKPWTNEVLALSHLQSKVSLVQIFLSLVLIYLGNIIYESLLNLYLEMIN